MGFTFLGQFFIFCAHSSIVVIVSEELILYLHFSKKHVPDHKDFEDCFEQGKCTSWVDPIELFPQNYSCSELS